jgi:hypothetical protein
MYGIDGLCDTSDIVIWLVPTPSKGGNSDLKVTAYFIKKYIVSQSVRAAPPQQLWVKVRSTSPEAYRESEVHILVPVKVKKIQGILLRFLYKVPYIYMSVTPFRNAYATPTASPRGHFIDQLLMT